MEDGHKKIVRELKAATKKALDMIPENEKERIRYFETLGTFDLVILIGTLGDIVQKMERYWSSMRNEKPTIDMILMDHDTLAPVRNLAYRLLYSDPCFYKQPVEDKHNQSIEAVGIMRGAISTILSQDEDSVICNEEYYDKLEAALKSHASTQKKILARTYKVIKNYRELLSSMSHNAVEYDVLHDIIVNEYKDLEDEGIIECLQEDVYNSLYTEQEDGSRIISNYSDPTADDWAQLLDYKLNHDKQHPILQVLSEAHRVQKLFDINDFEIIEGIHEKCKTFSDLCNFFDEIIRLNYIKQNINDLKKGKKPQTDKYESGPVKIQISTPKVEMESAAIDHNNAPIHIDKQNNIDGLTTQQVRELLSNDKNPQLK